MKTKCILTLALLSLTAGLNLAFASDPKATPLSNDFPGSEAQGATTEAQKKDDADKTSDQKKKKKKKADDASTSQGTDEKKQD